MTLAFNNFTYSMVCDDISWNYTAIMANGTTLDNNLINFTETSTGGLFSISSKDSSVAGTYDIIIMGKVGNTFTLNQTF